MKMEVQKKQVGTETGGGFAGQGRVRQGMAWHGRVAQGAQAGVRLRRPQELQGFQGFQWFQVGFQAEDGAAKNLRHL